MDSPKLNRMLTLCVAGAPLAFGAMPAAAYEILRINNDTGFMVTETCNPRCSAQQVGKAVFFNGATIRSGEVVDGLRRYYVRGDFVVNPNDVVTSVVGGSRQFGASFQVGNNASLRGSFRFGAVGGVPGAGGGAGGWGGFNASDTELLANGGQTPDWMPPFDRFGAAGGPGGAAVQAAILLGGVTWGANLRFGDDGSAGNTSRPGFAGLAGAGGASGGSGQTGWRGINNIAGGGVGGDGGAGGAGGRGGQGGTGGAGGKGGVGFKLVVDPDAVFPTGSSITVEGGDAPQDGAAGGRGSPGQDGARGGQGQIGGSASNRSISLPTGSAPLAARTVLRTEAVVFGGNGGGGSGQGGAGGQGGGGGQGGWGGGGGGSGGGNWCRNDCGVLANVGSDKPGGAGGVGGIGGTGGIGGGGSGGAVGLDGGGGGGALEIAARGVVRLGGTWQTNGAPGGSLLQNAGVSNGETGQPGSTGRGETLGQRGRDYVQAGATGGIGGLGGTSGAGAWGGMTNWGGGGSGGVIKVTGSVIIDESANVDVSGGFGGVAADGTPYGTVTQGADGHFFYGGNATTTIQKWWQPPGDRIVSETSRNESGALGTNPYVRAGEDRQTAYIPGSFDGMLGVQFGAELYGLLDQSQAAVRAEVSSQLRAWMPTLVDTGILLARVDRLAMGSLQGPEFPDFDWLLVANGGRLAVHDPAFAAGLDSSAADYLKVLVQGSFYLDPAFGGTGVEALGVLQPGQVWMTLVPRSAGPLQMVFQSKETGAMAYSLSTGEMAFSTTTPVPEPGTGLLMMGGLLMWAGCWRRRMVR